MIQEKIAMELDEILTIGDLKTFLGHHDFHSVSYILLQAISFFSLDCKKLKQPKKQLAIAERKRMGIRFRFTDELPINRIMLTGLKNWLLSPSYGRKLDPLFIDSGFNLKEEISDCPFEDVFQILESIENRL